MKKTLLLGILGLAASVVSSYGQGAIALNNYNTSITSQSPTHPLQDVKYGAGVANATVGAAVTTAANAGGPYVAGLYYVNTAGNFTASFAADASGTADPLTLYTGTGTLTLASVTGGIDNSDTGVAGEYAPKTSINPGLGAGATVTVMVVAYNGSTYDSSSYRGHSSAFTMVTSVGTAFPNISGVSENDGGFSVLPVPEPSVFALSSIGAAALMLIRRKK